MEDKIGLRGPTKERKKRAEEQADDEVRQPLTNILLVLDFFDSPLNTAAC